MIYSLLAGYWLRWQQKKDGTIFDYLLEGEHIS